MFIVWMYIQVNFQIVHQIEVYDLKSILMYNSKLYYNVIYIKTSLWCTIYKIHLDVCSQKNTLERTLVSLSVNIIF